MIITRTPLRVSFCGGGTDLPAYYRNEQGAVVSTAVNKYVYITVNRLTRYFEHRIPYTIGPPLPGTITPSSGRR